MLLLPLLLSVTAFAGSMSYDEVLDRAEEVNPDLAVAKSQVTVAEGSLLTSRGVWDPTLGVGISQNVASEKGRFQGVGYTSDSGVWNWSANLSQTLPTGTSWSASWSNLRLDVTSEFAGIEQPSSLDFESRTNFSVTQQLLRGYKLSYNLSGVTIAQANLRSAEASMLQQRQTTLSMVASAYWDLVYADEALAVAKESVNVTKEELRVVEAMVKAGTMAPIEVTRVRAALAQAEINRLEAQNGLDAASDSLAVMLNLPVGERITPATTPGEVPLGINLDMEQVIANALERNPGLQVSRVNVENAELNLTNARHGLLPTLSVTASGGLQGRLGQDAGGAAPKYSEAVTEMLSGDFNSRYIGADFSMPLGMRSERGQVQGQAATLDQAKLNLLSQEQAVAQQVATAVRTVETARERVRLAELNLVLAQETLAAEKARQEVGRAIQRDVLDAQRALDNARVEVIRVQTDYQKAVVSLEALQGGL